MLRGKMVVTTQTMDIDCERADCDPGSQNIFSFVREAANEMLRETLAGDATHWN